MARKQYSKPVVIDFSIELIPGVGADSCDTGFGYSSGTCGNGTATNPCSIGLGYSGACETGSYPFSQPGSACVIGGSAGSVCGDGTNASPSGGTCYPGGTAEYSSFCSAGSHVGNCVDGSADTNICQLGSGQISHNSGLS